MSNTLKILGAIAAVGAVAATTYVVIKKQEEKKPEEKVAFYAADGSVTYIAPSAEEVEKKETAIDRFKLAAQKKTIKIFTWIILHKKQLEALGVLMSVISGVFSVVSAAKEYYTGKKLRKEIDALYLDRMEFRNAWNSTIDNYDANLNSMKTSIEHVEHMIQEGV